MSKKTITTILISIVCIICAVCFSACGNNSVAGKTYVFSDLTLSYDATVTEDEKAGYIEAIPMMKEDYIDSTIEFGTDDKVTMKQAGHTMEGTYTQNESEIDVSFNNAAPQKLQVKGDELSLDVVMGNVTMTVIYTVK